ncbi:copper homeostasis protein CutC [Oleiagrimonas sp. C23AA]|uniref:copper homeostasis protein CutC n=1 Tax=Oleiagrimonas sp. C23AA TaxID=2719047 RepID=UPI0014237BF5|nr:copper homeostasis protein CutC [Oleiagrimonas sp. C23AA]NII10529.1 copper homeostasis protein CutC [Oleiagrimonas sp. C23AA]
MSETLPAGLEVAADSLLSALAAQDGGAMRVELCGGLDGGGLTPSYGSIAVSRDSLRIPLYVLIRPRTGDFVFSEPEVEVMCRDIAQCRVLGCDGVVLGALDADGAVDMAVMRTLIEAAGPLGVTFHRAFDVSSDLSASLQALIELGCERVLTSGGRATAIDGAATIAGLIEQAGDRIVVMPGSGVVEGNLEQLRQVTGASQFHASARGAISAPTRAPHPFIDALDGERTRTDVERVRRMVELLQRPVSVPVAPPV